MSRALVTGGAGFIGSALVRRLVGDGHAVLNVDKLTYAGRLETVAAVADAPAYAFTRLDVADRDGMARAVTGFRPDVIFHLAAETHVDRSIEDAADFLTTNVVGSHSVLQAALTYWRSLDAEQRAAFRVVMISTDEVFGSLGAEGVFTEETALAPNSPYAASKASADLFSRASYVTHGLPVIVTNCSNNYGPWQHPEKLIPTVLRNALAGDPVPIYGAGLNVRDWLHVEDHVEGLVAAWRSGAPGQRYNFGGDAERTNLDLAHAICAALDRAKPRTGGPRAGLIRFVPDRPGHDFRYAVASDKARRDLGWTAATPFERGIAETVRWFLDHPEWFERRPAELTRRGLLGD